MRSPILGGSYVARSPSAADNRMVNLFPEIIPEGGKEPAFLQRAPGLRRLATIGTGPIRGLWTFGNYGYVVSGTELYRLSTSWAGTLIGNVSGTGPVSMADNGTQLFVACNPEGFIYNATTQAFAQITDPDFAGAVTVGYLDGYFVFNQPNSQIVWVTSLLDGHSIDPLEFASAEGSPDGLVALVIDHREVWLFGTSSTEVWYNSAGTDFPLSPISGAYNEVGCIAPYSVVKLDNGIFWLGCDKAGQGIVYRAEGYSAIRKSTHAVEWQIQRYTDMSDAIGYAYQQDGHSFYVLVFPTANTTWVYDIATSEWHERAGFNPLNGNLTRHRSNCQMSFGGEIVVGDFENGRIYALDLETFADDDVAQKWLRRWRALPPSQNFNMRASHHSLELGMQSGVGLVTGQGSDPQVSLRWSDVGGNGSWSNELWRPMGKIGETACRVNWHRLGRTLKLRDRVYEVSGTDPVKIIITGAIIEMSGSHG
jgi:hypothetical protein